MADWRAKTLAQRLIDFVKHYRPGKYVGTRASLELGLSRDTLNGITRGRSKGSAPIFATLHEQTGVNLNWLLCGEGEPWDGAPNGQIRWPPTAAESMKPRGKKKM